LKSVSKAIVANYMNINFNEQHGGPDQDESVDDEQNDSQDGVHTYSKYY